MTASTIAAPRARPRSARLDRYGSVAVVTGASSGIGRALAVQLANDGFDLLLAARSADALRALAAALEAAHGVSVTPVVADLATREGCDQVLTAAAGLDVGLFIANAGFGTAGAFASSDLAEEEAMLALNCGALLRHTRHFAERFKARGRGGIILVSSVVSRQGTPWLAHYAATKAYVTALGEAIGVELAPHGVDLLVSQPGPTATGFGDRARMRMGPMATAETVAAATLAALGRRGTVLPGALAKALAWSAGLLPRALRVRAVGTTIRETLRSPA